jgi:4-methoxybenzoate monooxygenase (O-demethylating)
MQSSHEAEAAISLDIDPFSRAYLSDPYPFHEQLREAGPVVYISQYDVFAVSRFTEVREVLEDWRTFCSSGGVGLTNFHVEENWRRPSLLLESDPPAHTKARTLMSRVLSPVSIRRLRQQFQAHAGLMVDHLLTLQEFDAVGALAQAYTLQVFPDAVGLARDGREHLLAYGDMAFNTMGPKNDLHIASMRNAKEVIEWVTSRCERSALSAGGLGEQIYEAADEGKVTAEEAGMLVRSFLTAGVDTTINALGNAIFLFSTHPDQWQKLRSDPSRVRIAFEEVMRFESPFQAFFRTTTVASRIGNVSLPAEQKVYVAVGAANRDPRRWQDPDRFDVTRGSTGHVGFGSGIHACVGQMIARLEIDVMLQALIERVDRIDLVGTPSRLIHNTLRAFTNLPVRFHGSSHAMQTTINVPTERGEIT